MKILVVTPTFLPMVGGAEVGIYEIYQRLGRRHRVLVLTPRHPESVIRQQAASDAYFEDMSFETRYFADHLNPTRLRLPGRIRVALTPFSLSLLAHAVKTLREFRPDVVNYHYAAPCSLPLLVSRSLFRIPSALSLVGRSDVLGPGMPFLHHRIVSGAVRRASMVLPNSSYYLARFTGGGAVRVIPYGVDTARFTPERDGSLARERLGIAPGVPVLFALQRLSTVKRTDILIRAMPAILQRHGDAVLVIGGKGPEEADLRALAGGLGVSGNVVFAGYIQESELADTFAMADLFVFHSTSETFGIVLAQAMAAGKPIVSVNATSIPEVVDDGVTGVLVEPLRPEPFAAAVASLLGDAGRRRALAAAGREKAVARYSWDSVAARYETVLRELAEQS